MQKRLASLLLDVHALLNDAARQRGAPPGAALEMDIERLAALHWLPTERRIRCGALGSTYFSGLTPETDLFAYAKPEFLQAEVKDYSCGIGRAVVTELFARAMDLHLGRSRRVHPDSAWDHYVVLVAAGGVNQSLRVACLRFGICLVEPRLMPLPVLGRHLSTLKPLLVDAGCTQHAMCTACLPFSRRFPRDQGAVRLDAGELQSDRVVQSLLRFQELGTHSMRKRCKLRIGVF
jgi:hypothetical protein